jgi:pyruvate formate lyase activating enzyme
MNIRGIYKTTLVDYPGKISSVIFIGGCNLLCKYCHNPGLVLGKGDNNSISETEVIDFLAGRKNLIEGLTISGGEPTLEKDIDSFIEKVRALPLAVKLDTNGLNPSVLDRLVRKNLINYAAIDIKTSPEKYRDLTGKEVDFSLILESINILRQSPIDYELRTTCVPKFVTMDDFMIIKETVGFVKNYYLQQFVADSDLIDHSCKNIQPYPMKVLKEFRDFVQSFSEVCEIRG